MRREETEPGAVPGSDDVVLAPAPDELPHGATEDVTNVLLSDLDRADPADARPPLEVLESLEISAALALGQEGTTPVDWAALVEDRSGQCPECGLPDGPRHHKKCLAHPRGPNVWAIVAICLTIPAPLTLVAGPYAYGFFVPTVALALYIRTR